MAIGISSSQAADTADLSSITGLVPERPLSASANISTTIDVSVLDPTRTTNVESGSYPEVSYANTA